MVDISEKEIEHYVKTKSEKKLRVIKYFVVLLISVVSSYVMYYQLHASIWHIIILVISVELSFIVADMKVKDDKERDEKLAAEFIEKRKYFERKKQRREERLKKDKIQS